MRMTTALHMPTCSGMLSGPQSYYRKTPAQTKTRSFVHHRRNKAPRSAVQLIRQGLIHFVEPTRHDNWWLHITSGPSPRARP
ncbi:hypothetical protein NXS19_000795 [Fusarium pseudograminearum]|nr:hypothetical protein NXS19_000795 [Fusarium pseudograminearum]